MPKNFFQSTSHKAFTLVEILVVIGIITILSALVITALNPQQIRKAARDTNRKKDISVISAALEQYYADHNSYPTVTSFDCLVSRVLNGVDSDASPCSDPKVAGTVYLKAGGKTQSATATEYCYSNPASTQNYTLCAPTEAELTTTWVGGTGTVCTVGTPAGVTSNGLYCIQNPF